MLAARAIAREHPGFSLAEIHKLTLRELSFYLQRPKAPKESGPE